MDVEWVRQRRKIRETYEYSVVIITFKDKSQDIVSSYFIFLLLLPQALHDEKKKRNISCCIVLLCYYFYSLFLDTKWISRRIYTGSGSFEWSNFSIIHNHQWNHFILHEQRNKKIHFIHAKKDSKKQREFQQSIKIKGSIQTKHQQAYTSSQLIKFTLHSVAIFLSSTVLCIIFLLCYAAQQSRNERKKISTVIDLKAFSHYSMKAHTTTQSIVKFYSWWWQNGIQRFVVKQEWKTSHP